MKLYGIHLRNKKTREWVLTTNVKLDIFIKVPLYRYKIRLQKLRSLILFLNRSMYKVYNFEKSLLKLFHTIDIQIKNCIDSLYLELSQRKYPECNEKYIYLVIKSLRKYENPCMKILVIPNRLFCSDISRYITEFL